MLWHQPIILYMTLLVIEDHCSWCSYVLQVEWINSIHYVLHAERIKDHPELKLGLVFYVLQAEWIKDHRELFIYSWSIYICLPERIKDHPKPSIKLVWFPFNSSFMLKAPYCGDDDDDDDSIYIQDWVWKKNKTILTICCILFHADIYQFFYTKWNPLINY